MAAFFGAFAAGFHAAIHFLAANFLAGIGTGIAYIRASPTNLVMHFRLTCHEVGGQLAYLDAIRHQFYMRFGDMLATHGKAMIKKHFLTYGSAIPAGLDAFFHFIH
jgi:hypothetical protein